MKMKMAALGMALTVAGLHAEAQQIRAGVNLANVSITDNGKVDDAKQISSFQVGIIGDFPLVPKVLSLQPGLLFTGKGSETSSGDPNSPTYYRATSNPKYIEVPVNVVFKLPLGSSLKLFAGAGPYAAVGVGGKVTREGKVLGAAFNSEKSIEFSNDDPTTTNYEEGAGYGILRRFDYGLNGIAGLEGKSVVLGIGYGLGLAKLQSGSNSTADNNDKHRVLSFTLGFKF
ncbi:MAG: PorT family protein [Flaviaesturariibacter sp.]|nr:PorT family protein [Flaviaesturariibacter sp.]